MQVPAPDEIRREKVSGQPARSGLCDAMGPETVTGCYVVGRQSFMMRQGPPGDNNSQTVVCQTCGILLVVNSVSCGRIHSDAEFLFFVVSTKKHLISS